MFKSLKVNVYFGRTETIKSILLFEVNIVVVEYVFLDKYICRVNVEKQI